MPWCDDCDRFWTTEAVAGHADCPTCGTLLAEPARHEGEGAPWHFKLLVVGVVAYLGWRAVEVVAWVAGRF